LVERYRPKSNIEPQQQSPEARPPGLETKPRQKAKRSTYFTEASVRKFTLPTTGQLDYFEKLKRGLTLVLRASYGGTKAWRVLYYANSKPRAKTIGHYPELGVAAARKKAFAFDPKAATAAAEAGSFKEVAESWIKHYVDAKRLRSKREIERILKYYVYPEWARRPFFEIRRGDVNALLDRLVEKHGASQADGVLATLRSIMNWFQTRDENYVSPIVKGMRRDQRKASERARNRILEDGEIRAVWKACDDMGTYGALVKLLLLTAQRERKVVTMRWEDISDTGLWTIPSYPREKGNAGHLKLPELAFDIVGAQPKIADNPYVLAATAGAGPFNSFSQRREELANRLPASMPHWTLHDLRRTARSLMARVGIQDNIAERVLGHAIAGVEGTYNRHDYAAEKSDALTRLAALIGTILTPPDKSNIFELAARR
jgi:integrase